MKNAHSPSLPIIAICLILFLCLSSNFFYKDSWQQLWVQQIQVVETEKTCFFKGKQISSLAGSWELELNATGLDTYYTNTCPDKEMTKFAFCKKDNFPNCPWIMGHYWCGKERSKKIESIRYNTHHCMLPRLESRRLLNQIGSGNTLWYIGDSMTSEMYISTLCILHQFALPEFQNGNVMHVPNLKKTNKLRVSTSSCVMFLKQIKICFIKSRRVSELHKILLTLYEKNWKTRDIVIINYGLHPNSLSKSDIVRAFSHHQFRNPMGESAILWRETSPQHFMNPGGVFTREKLDMPCAPLKEEDYAIANALNLSIRKLLGELEIPVLEIWSISSERYDAHSNGECSHLCLPGVPDEWVRVLYAYLSSKNSG